ncbi:hypothetical protein SAMN04515671_2304 [Nakamurella panacisegetis]|uniref:Uncharacterized protein n=2 Tax=Nakamurella panacisegetis TaxID=1090615 RepID=A0A1H0NCU7_9ACTN|nr:hypothetical protein SAMN04515671_2304 [Nakamurella panacisegetis]
MSDPVEPVFTSSLAGDVFPDALSASPLPGLPSATPEPLAPPPSAPPVPAAPSGRPPPARAARAASRRPWEQFPPPGPATYVAPPNRPVGPPAQLAPPAGRRPAAGTGYQLPAPIMATPPVRPPAYLPQGQGMAQLRAALTQARSQITAPAPARTTTRKRSGASGAWGCLVVLGIVLFSSGAAQKIISAISDLLQRK